MRLSRREWLGLLGAAAAGRAAGQSHLPALPNIGFRADMGPARSECGVGALLPWAESLWTVTYNSHMKATGSGLALYRIADDLKTVERVHVHNGTHANRLVHKESNQAFIGPYAIDAKGNWKFIPEFENHRLTATMRHLGDPAGRVYVQTMEGLFFEMDVGDLKPRLLFDLVKTMQLTRRPHFKGGFTGPDRVVVANNGFYAFGEDQAGLFEFDGRTWNRLSGKPHMDCAGRSTLGNAVFCTGWDESSVLFWALFDGKWRRYRLPKASHAMEHAYQTEWMRIREVETEHFMVDIQGLFLELQPMPFEGAIWGLKPVCQHLRIIPDYCAFRGLLALGGNQTTPNGDSNPVAGQPQSGIWFCKTDDLWSFGKPQGWGGPWRRAAVKGGEPSEPFLMTGFDRKVLHLKAGRRAAFEIQVDFLGSGEWVTYKTLDVNGYAYHVFEPGFSAHWVRLIPGTDCVASAEFVYT